MSDPSPHIRHHVRTPDGKHVEVVYSDQRRAQNATGAGKRTDDDRAQIDDNQPRIDNDRARIDNDRAQIDNDRAQIDDDRPRTDDTPPNEQAATFADGIEYAARHGCAPDELHICFNCSGELVYPLDWAEEGPRHWRIVLRCPECEARREGVFEQTIVERLDDELDRGSAELLSDLKRITYANMTDEIEFFVRALDADLIVPSDF